MDGASHPRESVALSGSAPRPAEAGRGAFEDADFSRALLDSVGGEVAVLDASGHLVATNDSWDAVSTSRNPVVKGSSGTWILDATTLAPEPQAQLAAAIEAVLRDRPPHPVLEFCWETPAGRQWGEVRVQPLGRPSRGAVLTHQDVTARKRLEQDAQRLHEAAHASTVCGLGELAAAVAHELNQPLTAVLGNAQAARRILDGPAPCLADVRDILDDIIEQDKRAGEVVQRVRRILEMDTSASRSTTEVDGGAEFGVTLPREGRPT